MSNEQLSIKKKIEHSSLIIDHSQKGYSSMLILFFVVILIFIIWEVSQSITRFAQRDSEFFDKLSITGRAGQSPNPTSCPGGAADCEDRFDVFRTNDDGSKRL
ncbi:MAG: hypothetical protein US19_C0010G0018 [Candidatus Daviesbacteria bacterium GW2011_GWB1_36_5]|uniref:Uncharacterized protein n=1 Tax=Candidatus Daviesbacteria bacterium GW2011_GWB1_36_5 TaxID=1618426 RepID=A0A0G0F8L1_9BACT|nr:MAG: hypothetical protein US19_C0010G0018 [Candidatus Daviesbacteria bacterium GW2011_GWB1_36_5]